MRYEGNWADMHGRVPADHITAHNAVLLPDDHAVENVICFDAEDELDDMELDDTLEGLVDRFVASNTRHGGTTTVTWERDGAQIRLTTLVEPWTPEAADEWLGFISTEALISFNANFG